MASLYPVTQVLHRGCGPKPIKIWGNKHLERVKARCSQDRDETRGLENSPHPRFPLVDPAQFAVVPTHRVLRDEFKNNPLRCLLPKGLDHFR